jgi:hypothetical protein
MGLTPREQRRRFGLIAFMLAIVFVVVMARAAVLMLGEENQRRADLAVMGRTPLSLVELNQQMSLLRNLTADIDHSSFQQIRDALTRTITLVDRTNTELIAQNEAWKETRSRIKNDELMYRSLRANLDNTRRLQDEEIIRLKRMLDRAQRPSMLSDAMSLVFTFTLGVISSMLATLIYPWCKKRYQRWNRRRQA